MKDYLVTGASGFIGGHLVEGLVRHGHRVRCLVRETSDTTYLDLLGVEIARGDIGCPEMMDRAVTGVNVVFHLAGTMLARSAEEFDQINCGGTENVWRACERLSEPPVLVAVSSVAAAGPTARNTIRTEADRPEPISDYGRSKRRAEVSCEQRAAGVQTTIVRPGIVFGARDRATLPIFRSIARCRAHVVPGLKTPRLSLIHIDDLVEILLRAADDGTRIPGSGRERGNGRGYYFASAPEHPSYAEWGNMMKLVLNRRRAPTIPLGWPLPFVVAGIAQFVSKLRRGTPILTFDKVREARCASWACSSRSVRQELGFEPQHSLFERTRQTADWYRQQGWL